MSTLPENLSLPSTIEPMKAIIENRWGDLVRFIKGNVSSKFVPTVHGSTTAGTVTYSVQKSTYYRQGLMIDYWFAVEWTNWVGYAGNLYMKLPLLVSSTDSDYWVGSMITTRVRFANPAHTYCVPIAIGNSNDCSFWSGSHNTVKVLVPPLAAGGLIGHIRYLGQTLS